MSELCPSSCHESLPFGTVRTAVCRPHCGAWPAYRRSDRRLGGGPDGADSAPRGASLRRWSAALSGMLRRAAWVRSKVVAEVPLGYSRWRSFRLRDLCHVGSSAPLPSALARLWGGGLQTRHLARGCDPWTRDAWHAATLPPLGPASGTCGCRRLGLAGEVSHTTAWRQCAAPELAMRVSRGKRSGEERRDADGSRR